MHVVMMMIEACLVFLLSETVLILRLGEIVFSCVLNANKPPPPPSCFYLAQRGCKQ